VLNYEYENEYFLIKWTYNPKFNIIYKLMNYHKNGYKHLIKIIIDTNIVGFLFRTKNILKYTIGNKYN